ncbi:pentatricopeptide repeat-containing protein At3g63370, chloroplastic [Typha angustifolia]|uniref:pentatricopeptide repeat-containing protein At3g63370, chloroplastic n=1 Tax=Typha angustifolia TaxID=59011 RepID=UPI003C302C3E
MSLRFGDAFHVQSTLTSNRRTPLLMALSLTPPPSSSISISPKSSRLSRISLPYPDPLRTNTSLKEICRQGSLRHAFLALTNLAHKSPPLQEDYASILELCAAQKAIFQGRQIHAHIITSGSLGDNGFLATKLLFMYGKCAHIAVAHILFEEMPQRTIFAWNALIGAYASNGQPAEAIECYQGMRASGLMPDACTFASVLKACGVIGDVYSGSEVHGLAVKLGFGSITFVANAMVGMYAKCGWWNSAMWLFERLDDGRDVVSWNSIITGCVQNGQFLKALILFREMHKDDIAMNSYTAVGVLQACAELALVRLGMEIHAALLKCNHIFEIYESNALIVMYSRCGRIDDAIKVFSEMDEKDNVSWNSVLSGYVQNGLYNEAIQFYHQMLKDGFKVDQVSIISVASALGHIGSLMNGMEVHAFAIKQGFDSDMQVGNTLMDMYAKCYLVGYAERVFHKMPSKDYISWTTIIAALAQNSRYSDALELFKEVQKDGMKVDAMMIGSILHVCSGLARLPLLKEIHGYTIRHGLLDIVLENTIIDIYGECGQVVQSIHIFERMNNKDVVTWTSMITCYISNGLLNEALSLFVDMQEANIEPDAVALVSILNAVAGLSSLMKGKEIHGFLIRRNLTTGGAISSSLVDMYARCGNIDNSLKIFNRVEYKDLVLWTTMINATGMHGRGKEAVDLFGGMQEMGLAPDHITFLALLYACSHSRLIHEGKRYLEMMRHKYGLEPWPEHYVCIVDLLGRSGRIDEAYEFINSMSLEPTAIVWCALLAACRNHRNHKIAEVAAQKLLDLEPENPGNYVLISNVFAAMRKWKDVKEVRSNMEERGLRKAPACSWIEVGNKVHSFIARDNSHEDSSAIHAKLAEITERLEKEGGYIADTRFVLHDVREEEKINMLHGHSERFAIAFGLINTPEGAPIRITKNLRVCGDCHEFTKLVSMIFKREVVVRDANRFHHFKEGSCSCGDFW